MSLRGFLSKMVRCNPKRISKKFEGSNYNGKQLYERSKETIDTQEAARRCVKLQSLEKSFHQSVELLALTEGTRRNSPTSSARTAHAASPSMQPGAAAAAMLNPQLSMLQGAGAPGLCGLGLNSYAMPGMFNPALMGLHPTLGMGNSMFGGMGMNSLSGMNPAAMNMLLYQQQNSSLQNRLLAMTLAKNQIYERELMALGLLPQNDSGMNRKAPGPDGTDASSDTPLEEQCKRPIHSVSEDTEEEQPQAGAKKRRLCP